MFAGIVEAKRSIRTAQMREGCLHVSIEKPAGWKLALGESVNVDGICSTIVARSAHAFDVEYMPETLSKTTAKDFSFGHSVNLERSLKIGDRLHGHFVAGHVEACGSVVSIQKQGSSRLVEITLPKELIKFAPGRGSIAVNGVSLTIARASGTRITVALIPHTLTSTNLGLLKKGDRVNVEVDLVARYLVAGGKK